MTGLTIQESGMEFGPYPAERLYPIEESDLYKSKKDGIPIAEFLLVRGTPPSKIFIVEAKASSPRKESETDFQNYISEIQRKFTNAFNLGVSSLLGRHPAYATELPAFFQQLNLGTCQFRMVLVIRKAQREWLPPLQECLNQALVPLGKTWGLGGTFVVVMTEEMAKKKHLVSDGAGSNN